MKKKGFTLIELLAVVVVLGLLFMFVTPKLSQLIKNGGKTETQLIEERVLFAAREYANNYDSSFYDRLVHEGDINYIYKSDLEKSGLLSELDVSRLDDFVGVKGELLNNDKIKYTVQYINNSSTQYTNQELNSMVQNLNAELLDAKNTINSLRTEVSNVSSSLSNLRNQVNSMSGNQTGESGTGQSGGSSSGAATNSILDAYPIGSIYISTSSTNPSTYFGGTWVQYAKGRTLVGVDSAQTEFNSAEKTGGSKTHQHLYGFQYGAWFTGTILEANPQAGLLNYSDSSTFTITGEGQDIGTYAYNVNKALAGELKSGGDGAVYKRMTANTSVASTMQPYITVYMWKRTA